jgi:CRP/FNR family cyclic AMP-dependent transcriptional regulator
VIANELFSALARHPFLTGMSQAHLQILAGCAQRIKIDAGAVIATEGGPADVFYLIESGQVAIEIHTPQRGSIQVETVGPGGVVGWSWLVPPHRWQFDARAVESITVIAFDAACLRGHCRNDCALGYEMLNRLVTIIARRLTATRLQLLDVYK